MASLRRVKVLLVLNLIAVAGFVLFLAKCRPIAVRSGDAFHEIRPRAEPANLSAHSASPIQDAVLKRLSLLEDIVYRQLNGKDSRQRPRARQTSGALSAVLGGPHLLVSARSFFLSLHCLGQEARAAGKNYQILFCAPAVSLLLLWKHVNTAGSRSPRVGIIRRLHPKCRETSHLAKWDRRPSPV